MRRNLAIEADQIEFAFEAFKQRCADPASAAGDDEVVFFRSFQFWSFFRYSALGLDARVLIQMLAMPNINDGSTSICRNGNSPIFRSGTIGMASISRQASDTQVHSSSTSATRYAGFGRAS